MQIFLDYINHSVIIMFAYGVIVFVWFWCIFHWYALMEVGLPAKLFGLWFLKLDFFSFSFSFVNA